jgi:hypothetical protein
MGLFTGLKKLADKVGGVVSKVAKSPIITGALSMIPVVGGIASKGLQLAAAKVDANVAKVRAQQAGASPAQAQQVQVQAEQSAVLQAQEKGGILDPNTNRGVVMKSGESDLNDDGTPKTFWQKYKKWILIAAVPAALLPIVLFFVFRKPSGGTTANPRRQAAARKARLAKMAKAKKK